MRQNLRSFIIAAVVFALPASCMAASATNTHGKRGTPQNIQVGLQPYYLVEDMDPSPLKRALKQCSEKPLEKTDFTIGHRGAALQFPEHTKESYMAAARMGAGIVECDVTFTKERQLVCRHAQNDLHTTTNILQTPLAKKCTKGFTPAEFNPDGSVKTSRRDSSMSRSEPHHHDRYGCPITSAPRMSAPLMISSVMIRIRGCRL